MCWFHSWGVWCEVKSGGETVYITGPYGTLDQFVRICTKCGLAQTKYVVKSNPCKGRQK